MDVEAGVYVDADADVNADVDVGADVDSDVDANVALLFFYTLTDCLIFSRQFFEVRVYYYTYNSLVPQFLLYQNHTS